MHGEFLDNLVVLGSEESSIEVCAREGGQIADASEPPPFSSPESTHSMGPPLPNRYSQGSLQPARLIMKGRKSSVVDWMEREAVEGETNEFR